MNGWKKDKEESDKYMPEIKSILGQLLLSEPPIEEDMERNTDLTVFRMEPWRVACRIRDHKYLSGYRNQFTIRTSRPSGNKTELAKVIEGWGDYMFYGFATEDKTGIAYWTLIDLSVFRLWHSRQLATGMAPGEAHQNHDGSSGFIAFDIKKLPDNAVAARCGELMLFPVSIAS